MYTNKELDEAAREIDATIEGCFALGFDLEDRIEIIIEILKDKLGINDFAECETCKGQGTVDERLGGEPFSDSYAECPDCSSTS